VKDLASRHPLLRCDSSGPLYTPRLPSSAVPSYPSTSLSAALAATPSSTTWRRRLGHPVRDVLAHISHSADVTCTRTPTEHLSHACQLGCHVRLPFSSSLHATYALYSAFLAINTISWWLRFLPLLLDFSTTCQV
jgi:hypothetical protein